MMYFWIEKVLLVIICTCVLGFGVSFLRFIWKDSEKAGKLAITFIVLGIITTFVALLHCILG